jgi:hypothetical protein
MPLKAEKRTPGDSFIALVDVRRWLRPAQLLPPLCLPSDLIKRNTRLLRDQLCGATPDREASSWSSW